MIDLDKINKMIDHIDRGQIPENMTFNEFAIDFYNCTKYIPLSKYLRNIKKDNKLPKIIYTKKAGELLSLSKHDPNVNDMITKEGLTELPELSYRTILLLRKTTPINNWKKILSYLSGDHSIKDINESMSGFTTEDELIKAKQYVMTKLNSTESELEIILKSYRSIYTDKEISKILKKILATNIEK